MQNVIIFGPPGSGKGTQSEKIIEKFGFAHISTGDILRAEIKSGTPLGVTAAKFIDNGQLVPDDLIIDMLENKLNTLNNMPGVIFDGFPRTVEQAKALKEMLEKRGEKISVMINLEVAKPELIDRLLKRGQISGRSDDKLETIEKRIKVYESQTTPVIDFYKNEGSYHGVKGVGSIDEIFSSISESIESCV
ncbi:adenylate kinase [Alkalitalea saponilacus]|uniref:Adenylate kinase n=1 Tax=Alkalitalea saponilacus TaxID=889453 RepID=A0A1T5AE96_9BACT|nr:adenylate kinase [Alkalitalea saponilacus]ASB48738.1 adenylate kinase [Alkalitalea saponilacus]SKB33129.1 Adenylate kinase [Alkalitalea saponilacus]